ncbi:hypothetical protein [uncultured Nostoc sp.]|uniref:hypothetical protein n=1 Tax=uncultured Nostoc sp. TaxID=340711 RepID=UPI0035CB13CF
MYLNGSLFKEIEEALIDAGLARLKPYILDISKIVTLCGKRTSEMFFYHRNMSDILNHIEENPKQTQRLIGLEYEQLQQLIENAERLHHEKQAT